MKRYTLFSLVILSSTLLLYLLKRLPFEMFISFSPDFLKYAALTYAVWFSTIFLIILLSIKRKRQLLLFSLLFILIASFISTLTLKLPLSTALSFILAYSLNILYVYNKTDQRLKLFTKFKPKEIFSPILKTSFLIFTFLLTILNFFTTVDYINKNKQIITPPALITFSRPVLPLINRQISQQIEDILAKKLGEKPKDYKIRQEIAQLIIKEALETMSEGTIRQKLGFRPDVLPVEKIKVFSDGSIDIEPALVEAAPKITKQVNTALARYKAYLPFFVLVLTFLTLVTVMWVFDFLSLFLMPAFFLLAFKLKLIQKTKAMAEVEKIV